MRKKSVYECLMERDGRTWGIFRVLSNLCGSFAWRLNFCNSRKKLKKKSVQLAWYFLFSSYQENQVELYICMFSFNHEDLVVNLESVLHARVVSAMMTVVHV